jgi:hypothetical protein
MRNARKVKQFCRSLYGMQGGVTLFREGLDEFFLSHGYPLLRKELEEIRDGLEDLNLYEKAVAAIDSSEKLVREEKWHEAQMAILEFNRELSEASGANDDLRSMYRAANDS